MFTIKVVHGEGQFTMILKGETSGKSSPDAMNLTTIIDAFRQQFGQSPDLAILTIMDDRGQYYKQGHSDIGKPVTWVVPATIFEVYVPLNNAALRKIAELKAKK